MAGPGTSGPVPTVTHCFRCVTIFKRPFCLAQSLCPAERRKDMKGNKENFAPLSAQRFIIMRVALLSCAIST